MRLLIAAICIAMSMSAKAGWFADRRAHKERMAAEKAAEQETIRKKAEQMRRRLWREKQYSKLVDGLKDHLAKGRFKYLAIGFLGGTIITSAGIWYFCHDGCRLFNPVEEQDQGHGHGH